ncbi:aspartate kinase [Gandjariella thermophila]|uniref:Aspartokinase n=1 Tax=Gandjariella thermophila TaxID=1931992 RepID=A0A4D4JEG0_9PSEU|nr:aspartate kinase [Gandjariella thermophila]GDY32756.1 aspartokinase [Gandjariella thermophila]
MRKYGGTSLAGADRLRRAATSVARASRTWPTVVVVSARGDSTDQLLAMAAAAGERSASRETDQLLATGECLSAALFAMTLRSLGVPAVSLTGGQAGIRVVGPPGAGRIAAIDPARIHRHLGEGSVVVVAGFQGVGAGGDVVTLGRGGSDTTAVALAAELGVRRCEIYTDVAGVFDADPRVVPSARVLDTVPMDVMVEMAFAGARVLHSRSVELAAARGIDLLVRSALADGAGTVIPGGRQPEMLESHALVAIAHDLDVTRVLVRADTAHRDLAVDVLSLFARHHAPVDLVARSGRYEAEFRMGFTARRSDIPRLVDELRALVSAVDGTVVLDENIAKISLIGTGLLNRPEFTARLLAGLDAAGISTGWIATSQLRVSVTVPQERVTDALALLHKEFELGSERLVAGAGAR